MPTAFRWFCVQLGERGARMGHGCGPVNKSVITARVPAAGVFAQDGGMLLIDWLEERAHEDLGPAGVLGWAWATVDLERALSEAGARRTAQWTPVEDELLGARGLRLADVSPAVILLEPSTEGRLAGWLARNGEGEAVIYRDGSHSRTGTGDATVVSPGGVERTDDLLGSTRLRMTALSRPGSILTDSSRFPDAMPLQVIVSSTSMPGKR